MPAKDWVWERKLTPRDEIDIAPTEADMKRGHSVCIATQDLRAFIGLLEAIRDAVEEGKS